jgi:hypothetical protein
MTTSQNGTVVEYAPTAALVRAAPTAIEPQSFAELKELAKLASGSRFFGAETPEQCLMILMAGKDLGFSYTQSLRAFHVIKGKPTLSADGMIAACMGRRDVCEFFEVTGDDKRATATTKRAGRPERSYTFTMEDAQRAGLLANNQWKTHPQRMLQARAKAFLARDVYPDLLMGLYDPDEVAEATPRPAQRVEHVAEPVVVYDPQARATFLDAIEQATSPASLKETAKAIKAAEGRGILTPDDGEALKGPYTAKMEALKEAKRRTVDTATTTPAPAPASDEDVAAAIDRGDA